jgi:hypothetical protein
MPKESDCRRPDFVEGRPVALADGQEWVLPIPRVKVVPASNPDGIRLASDLGPEYDAILDRLVEAKSDWQWLAAHVAAARFLLLRNYQLAEADIEGLVQFDYGDSLHDELRRAVEAAATGRDGPKPGAAT